MTDVESPVFVIVFIRVRGDERLKGRSRNRGGVSKGGNGDKG